MQKIECDRALVGRHCRVVGGMHAIAYQFLLRDRTSFWYAIAPLVCCVMAHTHLVILLLVRDGVWYAIAQPTGAKPPSDVIYCSQSVCSSRIDVFGDRYVLIPMQKANF